MSLAYEAYPQPLPDMDDILVEHGVSVILGDKNEYLPDFSRVDRMRRVQEELASRGVATTLSAVYRRGDPQPYTSVIRRVMPLPTPADAEIIPLDDYR